MGDTATVRAAEHLSSEIYPLGQHRPKFMFLEAVTRLQGGETERFLATLKELVQQYPQNEITDLAAHILKGVQEGRLLAVTAIHSVLSGNDGVPNWPRQATCWATVRAVPLFSHRTVLSAQSAMYRSSLSLLMKKEK